MSLPRRWYLGGCMHSRLRGEMGLGRSLTRSIARSGSRYVARTVNRRMTYHRLQSEAASRPESERVETPAGPIWMSPIEAKLYEAMRREGLSPIPQFCVEGYYVDFAFPDIRMAVEADGAPYHSGDRYERDRKRDWVLRCAGWTVKRFYGSTIHQRAGNCAYVIRKEVEARRKPAFVPQRKEANEPRAGKPSSPQFFAGVVRFLTRNKRR